MELLIFLASRTKGDPTFGIILGVVSVVLLGGGLYALIKWSSKEQTRKTEEWEKAADALNFKVMPPSSLSMRLMKGTFEGREISVAENAVYKGGRTSDRYLFCQVNFVRPLDFSIDLEPRPAHFLQAVGGVGTDIPTFDDHFRTYTENIDYLKALLMAKPGRMDGRVLAEDFLNRLQTKRQRVCLNKTAFELAVRAEDSDRLGDRIAAHIRETIELADLIEQRAASIQAYDPSPPL